MRTLVLMLVVLVASDIAASERGTLCIAPVQRGNERPTSLRNPAGGRRTFDFLVRVGKERVEVGHEKAVKIANLDTAKEHLVQIFRDGKPFAAFKFRFEGRKTTNACLWFNELYETWSLTQGKPKGLGCKCA